MSFKRQYFPIFLPYFTELDYELLPELFFYLNPSSAERMRGKAPGNKKTVSLTSFYKVNTFKPIF